MVMVVGPNSRRIININNFINSVSLFQTFLFFFSFSLSLFKAPWYNGCFSHSFEIGLFIQLNEPNDSTFSFLSFSVCERLFHFTACFSYALKLCSKQIFSPKFFNQTNSGVTEVFSKQQSVSLGSAIKYFSICFTLLLLPNFLFLIFGVKLILLHCFSDYPL